MSCLLHFILPYLPVIFSVNLTCIDAGRRLPCSLRGMAGSACRYFMASSRASGMRWWHAATRPRLHQEPAPLLIPYPCNINLYNNFVAPARVTCTLLE